MTTEPIKAQWSFPYIKSELIKYDFDETPEQVKAHIDGVIQSAANK